MGGVVVLSRWSQHLSGARYFFVGLILPQMGGVGAIGPKKAAKHSRNEQYESPHSSNQGLDSAFIPEFRNEL